MRIIRRGNAPEDGPARWLRHPQICQTCGTEYLLVRGDTYSAVTDTPPDGDTVCTSFRPVCGRKVITRVSNRLNTDGSPVYVRRE